LSETRFLEGRLRGSGGGESEYGVVLATRGGRAEESTDVRVVEVEDVLEGARLARAGSA